MNRQNRSSSAPPASAASFWPLDGAGYAYAESGCRAWLDGVSGAQERVLGFVRTRLARDGAFLSELGKCRTPVEALNCEAAYVSAAVADFAEAGLRMGGLLTDLAQERMFGAATAAAKMPWNERGGDGR